MIRELIILQIKKKSIKQRELAGKIGVSPAALCQFLSGKSELRLSRIEALMKELQLNIVAYA